LIRNYTTMEQIKLVQLLTIEELMKELMNMCVIYHQSELVHHREYRDELKCEILSRFQKLLQNRMKDH